MQGAARKLSSTIQSFIALGSETLKEHVAAQTLQCSFNPEPHLGGHTGLCTLANIYNNCNFSLTHKAPKLCRAVIIVTVNSIVLQSMLAQEATFVICILKLLGLNIVSDIDYREYNYL
jgi:hypothetical protein